MSESNILSTKIINKNKIYMIQIWFHDPIQQHISLCLNTHLSVNPCNLLEGLVYLCQFVLFVVNAGVICVNLCHLWLTPGLFVSICAICG